MNKPRISIEEFSKIEVSMGTVVSAERVPDTDKLLRLVVDFADNRLILEKLSTFLIVLNTIKQIQF